VQPRPLSRSARLNFFFPNARVDSRLCFEDHLPFNKSRTLLFPQIQVETCRAARGTNSSSFFTRRLISLPLPKTSNSNDSVRAQIPIGRAWPQTHLYTAGDFFGQEPIPESFVSILSFELQKGIFQDLFYDCSAVAAFYSGFLRHSWQFSEETSSSVLFFFDELNSFPFFVIAESRLPASAYDKTSQRPHQNSIGTIHPGTSGSTKGPPCPS